VYRCAGADRWLALTITDDDGWRSLVDVVDHPDLLDLRDASLADRFVHHDAIDAALEEWLDSQDDQLVAARLQDLGIAACPAFSTADLLADPHLRARGFIVSWDQVDVGTIEFPGFPIHFERRDQPVVGPPGLGAHNDAVLRELGFDDEEIAGLWADDVVADRPPRG
jgi:crotonobetainyl-CoA:carnitine CoA-transferase CaiB-like acyl-CoA transferase